MNVLARISKKYPNVDISGMSGQEAMKSLQAFIDSTLVTLWAERPKTHTRIGGVEKEMMEIVNKIFFRSEIDLCAKCRSNTGLGPLLDEHGKLYAKLRYEEEEELVSDMQKLRRMLKESDPK